MATEAGEFGATPQARARRLSAVLRSGVEERVKPLELFFDLVFVLALTQCTALMSDDPTWEGLAKGLLLLGLLWWAWVGYAWFTSVADPEEGGVRLLLFGAMAAVLVAALCIPDTFDGLALEFAAAYGIVRYLQIGLFLVASRDEPQLRHSILSGLLGSTTLGVALLVVGALIGGGTQIALWALALGLDMAGPLLFGSEGWKLAPEHFAERHGLIMIIALGESIVAIGIGAEAGVDAGVVAAAVAGVGLAAALWWIYFDVVALVAQRRLAAATPGKEQIVPAVALLGGVSMYLLAHVLVRWRHIHSLNRQRLLLSVVLFALLPLALEVPALASVAVVTLILAVLIVFELHLYGESRQQVRHGTYAPPPR